MRSQLFKYSLGLAFSLVSLAAVATSCTNVGSGGEESQQSAEISSAPAPLSADRIAELSRQPKIDAQQLAALLGGRVPEGTGDACETIGLPCLADEDAIISPCSGFQGVCGSTGMEVIRKIRFFCLPSNGVKVCTAVSDQGTIQRGCTVPTEGNACSSGCNADTCDFDKTCDMTGDKMRRCFSGGTCHNDQCINQTFTDSVVGTCTRDHDTAGMKCFESELGSPPGLCTPPKSPICNDRHLCACLNGAQ